MSGRRYVIFDPVEEDYASRASFMGFGNHPSKSLLQRKWTTSLASADRFTSTRAMEMVLLAEQEHPPFQGRFRIIEAP